MTQLQSVNIIKMRTHVVQMDLVIALLAAWSEQKQGRYVCVANVHMCMETYDHADFEKVVNGADLTVTDGRPLVWAQKWLGYKQASQVRGADLTEALCCHAEQHGLNVGFYGGTQDALSKLQAVLSRKYPKLNIAYCYSPPFRALSDQEQQTVYEDINQSKVKFLFVGLGCPKQENWMASARPNVSGVMLGVGAAFDFLSGTKKMAPEWLSRLGLEWLLRLICEPRRLWKRYLKHNPRFVFRFSIQWLKFAMTRNR